MLRIPYASGLTMSVERRQLRLEGQFLELLVKRSARRKRRLSLSLNDEGEPLLQVPVSTSNADIEAMVKRHLTWLEQKQALFYEQLSSNPPLRFVDGEQIEFLGKKLNLSISIAASRAAVTQQDERLIVTVPAQSATKMSAQLQRWYRQQAQQFFSVRLGVWSKKIPWVVEVPPLRIRRMRARWGSCSSDGRICLNSELIRLDPCFLDYVIAHELCHLQEFNHSKRFYILMDTVMPDWRVYRQGLANVRLRRLP